jgi:hypothetical protein
VPYINQLNVPDMMEARTSLRSKVVEAMVLHAKRTPSDTTTSRLFTSFLLRVDKSARECLAGREALVAYVGSSNETGLFIEGLGRYETCISTVKRAFRLFERLKNRSDFPMQDRTLRNLIHTWDRSVTDVRDGIEHMDERIAANELADGEAHALIVDKTGSFLELGSHRLSFIAVHGAIKNLYRAGTAMIEALPLASTPENA